LIEKIGVIGAGAMGSSIAEVFAYNGYSVYLKDQNLDYVKKGISHARKVMDDFQSYSDSMPDREINRIEKNGIELTEAQKNTIKKNLGKKINIDGIINRIHPAESYEELAQCGLVIEAVFEKQEIKNDLFKELSKYFGANTIVASNTSSLSITEMAANYRYPENNVIIHFFNPPYTMPLVEIVPALQTSAKTVDSAFELISGLRNHRETMVPVKAKERSGFIVNRILIQLINEAIKIVEEGVADEKSVDTGMKKGAGFPMGPFELGDYVGLDIVYDVLKSFNRAYGDAYIPPERLKNMVIAGYLGRKTGRGFYEYGK
jgi:3-hydroxybutyryl-CoA dehydrogenase